ncbi:MAG: phage virion morphogenesis protein, partial [Gammaproteobacteria bacterium]|nr:phage virion morphogenesis protein [Gammaproteobacteria bacterium]
GDDSRGIPARPFLGLSLKDKFEVKGITQEWLMDLFR